MALSVLADGSKLSRLIVPKALLMATAQTLQSRVGGLVGMQVCHVPFSRRTSSDMPVLGLYIDLHAKIRRHCGVMLTTPDHLLSFKLSGDQRLADGLTEQAQCMIDFQRKLNELCRDIIDESDLSLGVKTQLIYPSGPQIRVDGAPQRWEVAEELLSLVVEHLDDIRRRFPRGLEISHLQAGQGFPVAYFLSSDAEDELHRLLVDDVCNGRTSFLRSADPSQGHTALHDCIRRLLHGDTARELKQNGVTPRDSLEIFADKELAPKVLLMIRGLVMHRILLLCLKKRWNVQYGIHPDREPIAVPYEAKGVPSEQAEFGHPDVSIILTILSFYYGGLEPAQFRESLGKVIKSEDPAAEYDRFTQDCETLPERLRHCFDVNIDDEGQVEELYKHLRLDQNVMNHYMNTFVFPVHAKQFARKLSGSA